MIKCPFCQINHVDNTIFCNECGAYLLEDDKRETDKLDTLITQAGWLGKVPEKIETSSTRPPGPRPQAIRLSISELEREVEVSLNDVVHIGRVDPTLSLFPMIDLTGDSPPAKSVSRRHARILKQGDTVVIEDLGSINGTFINGKRIDPYLPEPLKDGDTLQLGKLLINVAIVKQ